MSTRDADKWPAWLQSDMHCAVLEHQFCAVDCTKHTDPMIQFQQWPNTGEPLKPCVIVASLNVFMNHLTLT